MLFLPSERNLASRLLRFLPGQDFQQHPRLVMVGIHTGAVITAHCIRPVAGNLFPERYSSVACLPVILRWEELARIGWILRLRAPWRLPERGWGQKEASGTWDHRACWR